MVEVTNEQTPLQTAGSLVKEFNIKKKNQGATRTFRKNKAEGAGNVPSKVLKTGGDTLRQRCYQIILLVKRFEKNPKK